MRLYATHYQLTSDEQLFRCLQNDDLAAFKELYERYRPYLLRIAAKELPCTTRAEDMVQEIFTSFYQRRKSLVLIVSIKAYLCQALRFKLRNEARSNGVREAYKKTGFSGTFCKNDFANDYERKELQSLIDRSVNALPKKCKQAFLLSREENLSYKDISAELEISVSTVEKHISKALKYIKGNLNL
ncbi:MAG: RNA polymerase sigma-70 factor, partial [Chitinophagaceae bacterium]